MRAVFFGTPEFAVPSLTALLDAGINVAAVVTQPDRPHARSHSTLVAPPTKQSALARQIPVLQPERPRGEEFLDTVRALDADIGVVVAYGHLLAPDLLAIPRLGMINVHASRLPRWRGAAPIQWAVLSGDTETGVTIMRIEAGLDTGAVWHSRSLPIGEADTAGTLMPRLADLGAAALLEALPRIVQGEQPVPQPASGITLAPKMDRARARVRWDEPARTVSCRIRAMDPAPGAWTTLGGTEVKLFGPTVIPGGTNDLNMPGAIVADANRLLVAAADGLVHIDVVQPSGKRRMSAAEWLHGAASADPLFR